MTQVRDVLGRARPLAVAAVFVAASFIPLLSLHSASADALTNRSLMTTSSVASGGTYSNSTVAGNAGNGNEVGHTYTFTTGVGGTIEGISFEACDTAFGYLDAGTCEGDPGEVTGFSAPATFPTVTVNGTAFTYGFTDASYWTLTNATGVALAPATQYTVTFTPNETQSFMNPDANTTYFVHLTLWGTDTFAANYDTNKANLIDEGTVTSSTATAIDINTRVQETLRFSVEGDLRNGEADNLTGVPFSGDGAFNGPRAENAVDACTPLNGLGTIKMGNLADDALSSTVAYDARSYFRLATNSANGARVFYAGETLTSGSEIIDAIGGAAAPSTTGQEQFGLAFDNTYHTGDPLADLASVDDLDDPLPYASDATGFAFVTATAASGVPQLLAQSDGVVGCDTGAIRYIANIAEETAAGIYSTRVVYIASPSY